MSIDVLQAKIRKTKNPSMICIAPSVLELPMPIKDAARAQYGDTLRAAAESYRQFSFGILDALKDVVPAVSIVGGAFCRPWLRRRGRDGGRARPRAGAWLLCPARSHARRRGAGCRGHGPRLLWRHPGRGTDLPMPATACS